MKLNKIKSFLGKTDMYLIDMLQKGYFDKPLSILDAGCGRGRNIWMLAQLGHKINACDVDEQSIEYVKSKSKELSFSQNQINLRVGEIGKLPYIDGEFDLVICNAVLHFAKDEIQFTEMMKDLHRVVKKEGVVFARFVSSHTFDNLALKFNQILLLPDGSNRFIVDKNWLLNELFPNVGFSLLEEFKTINVNGKRTMTTVVLRAK